MKSRYIREIRAFNRFYTNIIGLLDRYILNSGYSLPEVRIMFELYHHNGLTASGITTLIDIDKGYLSRILTKLEKDKLISKDGSQDDKRAVSLVLTAKGKKEFDMLNKASDKQIEDVFKALSEKDTVDLVQKMREIKQLIEK